MKVVIGFTSGYEPGFWEAVDVDVEPVPTYTMKKRFKLLLVN